MAAEEPAVDGFHAAEETANEVPLLDASNHPRLTPWRTRQDDDDGFEEERSADMVGFAEEDDVMLVEPVDGGEGGEGEDLEAGGEYFGGISGAPLAHRA